MNTSNIKNEFKYNFNEFQKSLDLFFNITHDNLRNNPNYSSQKEFSSILTSYIFKVYYGNLKEKIGLEIITVDRDENIYKEYSLSEFNNLLRKMNKKLNNDVYNEKELIKLLNKNFEVDVDLYEDRDETDTFLKKEIISKIVKIKKEKNESFEKFKSIQAQLIEKIQSQPSFKEVEALQLQLKKLMVQLNNDTKKIKEEMSFDEYQSLYKEKNNEFKKTKELIRKEIISYERKSNPEYIIETKEGMILFNEIECNKFLKKNLNKETARELVQAYFLILYISQYGFKFYDENGKSLKYNIEFKKINQYQKKIEKKLYNNIKISKVLKSINITLKDISPLPDQKKFIIENIIPNIFTNIQAINDEHKKEELISFIDNVMVFRKEYVESFLNQDINDTTQRELIQSLMIEEILTNFKNEATINNIILDNSTKEIIEYKKEMVSKLSENISEKELYEQITFLAGYLELSKSLIDKIFHNMSVTINAKEDRSFFKNDAMAFVTTEKKLVKAIFVEDVCEKLLKKPSYETNLRELSQLYFMNELITKSFKLKNTDNFQIVLEDFENLPNYIPRIEIFLKEHQKEESFQKSIDIILNNLSMNEKEREFLLYDILTPLKSKLNFDSSKILKRLL